MKPASLQAAIKASAAKKKNRIASQGWKEPVVKVHKVTAEDMKKKSTISAMSAGSSSSSAVPNEEQVLAMKRQMDELKAEMRDLKSGMRNSTSSGKSADNNDDEVDELWAELQMLRKQLQEADVTKLLPRMKKLYIQVKELDSQLDEVKEMAANSSNSSGGGAKAAATMSIPAASVDHSYEIEQLRTESKAAHSRLDKQKADVSEFEELQRFCSEQGDTIKKQQRDLVQQVEMMIKQQHDIEQLRRLIRDVAGTADEAKAAAEMAQKEAQNVKQQAEQEVEKLKEELAAVKKDESKITSRRNLLSGYSNNDVSSPPASPKPAKSQSDFKLVMSPKKKEELAAVKKDEPKITSRRKLLSGYSNNDVSSAPSSPKPTTKSLSDFKLVMSPLSSPKQTTRSLSDFKLVMSPKKKDDIDSGDSSDDSSDDEKVKPKAEPTPTRSRGIERTRSGGLERGRRGRSKTRNNLYSGGDDDSDTEKPNEKQPEKRERRSSRSRSRSRHRLLVETGSGFEEDAKGLKFNTSFRNIVSQDDPLTPKTERKGLLSSASVSPLTSDDDDLIFTDKKKKKNVRDLKMPELKSMSSTCSDDDSCSDNEATHKKTINLMPHRSCKLYEEQRKDAILRRFMTKGKTPNMSVRAVHGCNLVFFSDRIYIPSSMRDETMDYYKKKYLYSPISALERNCFWPDMRTDMRNYVPPESKWRVCNTVTEV